MSDRSRIHRRTTGGEWRELSSSAPTVTPSPEEPAPEPVTSEGLAVSGKYLMTSDNKRWIGKGTCQYVMYPDSWWAQSSGPPWENFWKWRVSVSDTMVGLGINCIRLDVYSFVFNGTNSALTTQQWLDRMGTFADLFTSKGIWVFITDHAATGAGDIYEKATLSGFRTDHFPMATAMLKDARLGGNPMVVFEPMNEPGPVDHNNSNITETQLIDHYKLIIDHYRNAGHTRPLVLDSAFYANVMNESFCQALTAYDSQVAYAMHRYPKAKQVGPSQIDGKVDGYWESDRARHLRQGLALASKYPLLHTEIGPNIDNRDEWNDPDPPRPAWFREALDALNGDIHGRNADAPDSRLAAVFPWKWSWTDNVNANAQCDDYWREDLMNTLSTTGTVCRDRLWQAN